MHELENNLVYILLQQAGKLQPSLKNNIKNVNSKNEKSIEAMHQLKEQARMMKEALLKGRLNEFGEIS